jgi:hypothetical protein
MSHQYSFRVAANTIGKIVLDTCKAIFSVLDFTVWLLQNMVENTCGLSFIISVG